MTSKKRGRGVLDVGRSVDEDEDGGRPSKCPTPQPEGTSKVPQTAGASGAIPGFDPNMVCK